MLRLASTRIRCIGTGASVALALTLFVPGFRSAADDQSPKKGPIEAKAEGSWQTAPPGKLVDIGGYRLHPYCLGDGSPPVILLYGGGGRAADFNLVQPAVAQFTRACGYDRAGDAWSESGPQPRTMRQNAYELHTLVQKAGVNGPYVLAGQSYGGLLARDYARQFPKEVAGLVLIDSMHEDALLGVNGKIQRLRLLSSGKPVPPIQRELAPTGKASPQANDFLAEECAEIYAARQSTTYPLGDIPLIVLSAGVHRYPKGGNVSAEDMTKDKERLQADLTTLSRNSKQIIAKKSGHAIHREEPQLVIDAIRDVVQAVRAGTSLQK
jgi:pimeloyl-ACP methyl ester carboxylesterase